ncbi:putative uncharacterized protein DDB_G0286901 [Mytilus trossulus]|uniref:putative uncharacterized protein DDB_G0286901 n=1 Tax=Mytilus trossulus TaxID=6551 RepID=UPI0030046413
MKTCILISILVIGVVTLSNGIPVAPVKKDTVSASPINTEKHANTFSTKRKKTNNFSYINAIAEKNGVNMKEFSYKNQNFINSLKTKLNSGNQDKLKFSYTEALKKYIQAHGKSQGTKQITSVANLMKILDVVKADVGHPAVNKAIAAKSTIASVQSPQTVNSFGNQQFGISNNNAASQQSGISNNNVASQQSSISSNNAASRQSSISHNNIASQQSGISHNSIAQRQIGISNNNVASQQSGISHNNIAQRQIGISNNNVASQQFGISNNNVASQQSGISHNNIAQRQIGISNNNVASQQFGISNNNAASKQFGISYNNVISKLSGISNNNVASKQTVISAAGTPKPIQQSTLPTKATTEQQETEAPDSEQTATTMSSIGQQSRCYCMEKCLSSTVSEGQCGKPNSSGIRKSKCCTPKGGGSSIEVGEAEEELE